MASKDFTYQELMSLGKSGIHIPIHPDVTIPVLRDGQVVWVSNYTSAEHLNYQLMYSGLLSLSGKVSGAYFNSPIGMQVMVPRITHTIHPQTVAIQKWGLSASFPLVSHAALFYLLYNRHVRGDELATEELGFFVDSIAPIIANYLDMACAGEARHMVRMNMGYSSTKSVPEGVVEEALASGKVILNEGYVPELVGINLSMNMPTAREVAWEKWYGVRKRVGIPALDWCIIAHCMSKDSGYGGPLWANAANLVRKRELKQISDVYFIDQAFSIQHNGGTIFNKIWIVTGLDLVLDAAFNGSIEKLTNHLDDEDRKIYNRVCSKLTFLDGVKYKGKGLTKTRTLDSFTKSAVLGITN